MTAAPRLAHVAIIVRDLEAETAVPVSALGLSVRDHTTVPGEQVAVSFIPVGPAEVELIQALFSGGPLERFLDARGEGIHHVALRVPGLAAAVARAEAAGLRLAGGAARPGAHGTRVAFVHPSSVNGLLVELIESG
ncbi:MAG TPA: VOC family protein [bacterium]|nr:VOC family protein [bacterium]